MHFGQQFPINLFCQNCENNLLSKFLRLRSILDISATPMWVKCYKSKSESYKVIYVETVPYTNIFIMGMVHYSSSCTEFYGGHCRHGPSKHRV